MNTLSRSAISPPFYHINSRLPHQSQSLECIGACIPLFPQCYEDHESAMSEGHRILNGKGMKHTCLTLWTPIRPYPPMWYSPIRPYPPGKTAVFQKKSTFFQIWTLQKVSTVHRGQIYHFKAHENLYLMQRNSFSFHK